LIQFITSLIVALS